MSSAPAPLHALRPPPVTGVVGSFDGTPIAYDVYDQTSRSLVLIVPGFWRDRRHPSMLSMASHLTELGYRTAIADPRGHGDSGGTYGFNLFEHYDTAAVAEELLRRLPIESITIVALSYGASIAISTAARHKLPIASLLLISAVADFSKITPRVNPFQLHKHIAISQALKRPKFVWQFRSSPKLQAIDDVRDVHAPICLVHVKNDWRYTRPRTSRKSCTSSTSPATTTPTGFSPLPPARSIRCSSTSSAATRRSDQLARLYAAA